MLLIRVYPFVFVDHMENKVILYDTNTPSFQVFEIEGDICILNRNAFSLEASLANENVARKIELYKLGIYNEVSSLQKFYLSDISSEISDRLEELCNKSICDVKDLIRRLIISLSPSLDVFSGLEDISNNSKMQISDAEAVYKFTRLTSLSCLLFYIDKNVVPVFSKIYTKLLFKENVEIALPLQDYQYIANDVAKLGVVKVILLVYEVTQNSLEIMSRFMTNKNITSFWVYISNADDYVKLQSSNMLSSKKNRTKCNLQGCLDELKVLLSYGIEDVLAMHVSKNNCIRNDWINLNFWGDLFVNAFGEVLINSKKIIGNINSWNNIQFEKLLSEDSLWRKIRRNKDKCKICLFRNICSPISLIEEKFNCTFCNLAMF